MIIYSRKVFQVTLISFPSLDLIRRQKFSANLSYRSVSFEALNNEFLLLCGKFSHFSEAVVAFEFQ